MIRATATSTVSWQAYGDVKAVKKALGVCTFA